MECAVVQKSNDIISKNTLMSIGDVCKITLTSAWLIYLYVLCMSLVMSSLSGSLFQVKLNKIEKPNETPLLENLKIQTVEGAPLSFGIKDLSSTPTKSNSTSNFYSLNEIIAGFGIWKTARRSIEILKFSMFDTDHKKELKEKLHKDIIIINEEIVKTKNLKIDLFSKNKIIEEKAENSTPKMENIEKDGGGATIVTNKIPENFQPVDSLDDLEANLGLLEQNLAIKYATLDLIILDKIDPQLIPMFLEVASFNKFFDPINNILKYVTFGILTDHFWQYPRPILKLNLILSMGILGSLIFVTIQFIRHPLKYSLEMYFFRPFLGMLMALAMYVMVKSGQWTFLDSKEKDLSPFLISFLGIISGMLAEQAYRRISFTGISLFRTGTNSNMEDQQRDNNSNKENQQRDRRSNKEDQQRDRRRN